MISRSAQERMWFAVFRIAALTVFLFLFAFLLILSLKGARVINWEFLTQSPREGMTEGGSFPPSWAPSTSAWGRSFWPSP